MKKLSKTFARVCLVFTFCLLSALIGHTQELPLGYTKYYDQSAAALSFQKSLHLSSPDSWKVSKYKCSIIEPVFADSGQQVFLPLNQGIIPNYVFGEYILEFECKILDSCHADSSGFYFLSPVKSCDNYYAFCFTQDSLIFYYPNKYGYSKYEAKSHGLNIYQWNKIRVERDMLKRALIFRFGPKLEQKIILSEKSLVMGYIGFGTHDVESAIKNIRIWAPTAIEDKIFSCE
jgi:hypothetical protein